MESSRGRWWLAGLIAGGAGLATSYLVASLMSIREAPVVAVADLVIRLTPGPIARAAIDLLGHADKPALVIGILAIMAAVFAGLGGLARSTWWAPPVGYAVLATVGALAVLSRNGAHATDALPVAVGFVTWLVALSLLTRPLREDADGPGPAGPPSSRRGFLIGAGAMAAVAGVLGVVGRIVGGGRRKVEETRRLLRLEEVTEPPVPPAARIGVDGVSSWMTPADEFYLIDTAIVRPAIEPREWTLRIHGMVDREVTLSFDDLQRFEPVEQIVTLTCVSNPVGGDLISNAKWTGYRVRDLLAEVGIHADADMVLSTSVDGFTAGTPVEALTDQRDSLLAIGMNDAPLPTEHGYPARLVVPGLYGYVSATKWLAELELTRFDRAEAYWTKLGWSVRGPIKTESRIDVPRQGAEVPRGATTFGGVAGAQHRGITAVEVRIDDGPWQPAQLGASYSNDTWRLWSFPWQAETPGPHEIAVRATDSTGTVQTQDEADVVPDGATGWHTVSFDVQ